MAKLSASVPPEVKINMPDLSKAWASPTGTGQFAKAAPHDSDFYAGIIKPAAL